MSFTCTVSGFIVCIINVRYLSSGHIGGNVKSAEEFPNNSQEIHRYAGTFQGYEHFESAVKQGVGIFGALLSK